MITPTPDSRGPIQGYGSRGACGDQLLDVSLGNEDVDVTTTLPPFIGEGMVRAIEVGETIGYHIVRHGPSPEGYTSSLESEERFIKFGYLRAPTDGAVWCEGYREARVDRAWALPISARSGNTHFRAERGASLHMVILLIDSELVQDILGDEPGAFEEGARRLLFGPRHEPFMLDGSFDARAASAIARVEACPFREGLQRLYLEGLALELSALSLEPFLRRLLESPRPIDPRERRLLLESVDLLDEDRRSPPSLAELARGLGMSLAKLKRDFPRVHGVSPHEYLVMRRMENARKLLADGASVKEAAYCAGLRSESYFIAQYRRRFGQTPGHSSRGLR